MTYAEKFTNAQRQIAYKQGQKAHGRQVAKQQAQVRKNRSAEGADTSKGKVHFEGDRTKLNKTQRASLDAMEVLAKALGVQIYVFESEVDENGNHVGANGWYDPSDGSIHIDLYAGNSGKGTMLFTVAHELAHFIKQWSPSRFERLANFLTKQYTAQGQSVSELVEAQQDKAARNGRELDYETAYEEMVADSMETMLADGSIIEMMAELRQQDHGLWQKICDWFKDLAGKLRAVVDAYKGVEPDSTEGRMVADMKDMIGTLQALYMDALVDASENFDAGVQKITTEDSGGVRYQAKNGQYDFTKSFAEQLADFQNGKFPERDTLTLGGTPNVLKKIGLIGLPMTINQKHIGDALNGTYKGTQQEKLDHTFTPQELATLPEKLANPIAIIHDKRIGKGSPSESNVDVIIEMKVASGKKVIAAVQIGGNGHINGLRIDTNKVSTVHGNSDTTTRLADAINDNLNGKVAVFYLNNVKTTKVLQSAGNPIPRGLSNLDGFIHSITDPGSPVKMRITSVAESQQFKRWFGDWQNHPEGASKIVNADGTPKVMYHGTRAENGDFYVFDEGKAVKKGGFGLKAMGKGNYFTAKKLNGSERYGSRVITAYLDIKKPFVYKGGIGLMERVSQELGINTDGMNHDALQQEMRRLGYDGVVQYNADGEILIAVTFDSNQIKSATDNIGTFDGSNPDIRYSQRDVGRQEAVTQALEKENAKLREDVAELRELVKLQRQVTNGTKFTKTSVEAAAISLKQSANAKGDTKGFAKLLNGLYEYIASSKELTWEGVKEQAQGAVDWLWEHIDRKGKRGDYAWENNCHGGSLAAYR